MDKAAAPALAPDMARAPLQEHAQGKAPRMKARESCSSCTNSSNQDRTVNKTAANKAVASMAVAHKVAGSAVDKVDTADMVGKASPNVASTKRD